MRALQDWLLPVFMLPMTVYTQEATAEEVHGTPAVRGSITANMLQGHDNPFMPCPCDTNYLIYTQTSGLNKEAIASYDWAEDVHKDEVKFQLNLASPLRHGTLDPDSVSGASHAQKSWWQLLNSEESSPSRETDYEPQLFFGFATGYRSTGWTLRDMEIGRNHNSNRRSDPTSHSWNRLHTCLMVESSSWLVEVKPWCVVSSTDDNPGIIKYMGYYQLRVGYRLGDAVLNTKGQHNWNTGYSGAELDLGCPITRHACFYTQVYSGYGGSPIDYNFSQIRVGVGVMLNDLF